MLYSDASITVSRGKYHVFTFDLVDQSSGLPVQLTGYSLYADFRERESSPLLLTIAVTVLDALLGKIQMILDEDATMLLPSRDHTHRCCDNAPFTCWGQIDGLTGGHRYELATITVDNISSTRYGQT